MFKLNLNGLRFIPRPSQIAFMSTYTEAWLSGPQSTQFYTRKYTPSSSPKAVIVFLHGFAEHIGRYSHFHPRLSDARVAVFAFDQRGFGMTAQDTKGNKSKGSSYGKTSWVEQMADINWAIEQTVKEFPDTPLFLMGHSMGGGEILGFVTQGDKSPYHATITRLAGAIATSPLIVQTHPASKVLRWIGGKASKLVPHSLIPAAVNANDLSHDPQVNDAYLKDSLVKQAGSLRGIHDMLTQGEELLVKHHRSWPSALPLLLIHGTADKVTSHEATQDFYNKITANNKEFKLFEGRFHELHNEPDGVQDQLLDEIVSFIDSHNNKIPKPATAAVERPRL